MSRRLLRALICGSKNTRDTVQETFEPNAVYRSELTTYRHQPILPGARARPSLDQNLDVARIQHAKCRGQSQIIVELPS